jgi:hypothetical protein
MDHKVNETTIVQPRCCPGRSMNQNSKLGLFTFTFHGMTRGDVAPEEFDIEYMKFFVGNKTTEHLQVS